ncbi:hypothetical protein CsSME_00027994 [Camellia sinensis var. sinensis]
MFVPEIVLAMPLLASYSFLQQPQRLLRLHKTSKRSLVSLH